MTRSALIGTKFYKENILNIKYVVFKKFAELTCPGSTMKYTDYNWFKGDVYFNDGSVDKEKDTYMMFDFMTWMRNKEAGN